MNNAELIFRREVPPRRATDVLHDLCRRFFLQHGFLSHLRSSRGLAPGSPSAPLRKSDERLATGSALSLLLNQFSRRGPATERIRKNRDALALLGQGIGFGAWARPTLGRLLLLSVGIHRRRALGRLCGFGAGVRRRRVSRRRLDHARLDIDRATRPTEIVSPTARRRGRLALREGAVDGWWRERKRRGRRRAILPGQPA